MQEIIIKIGGITEKINPSMVFHSRNPMTGRFGVNIYYTQDETEKWIQLFCQEESTEEPAKTLSTNIREGNISDLTEYLAERRL